MMSFQNRYRIESKCRFSMKLEERPAFDPFKRWKNIVFKVTTLLTIEENKSHSVLHLYRKIEEMQPKLKTIKDVLKGQKTFRLTENFSAMKK